MRRAGFRACLTKPVRQSQLFDAVVEALAADARCTMSQPTDRAAFDTGNDGRPLQGPRVLLAEDNEINQEVACELLAGFGCKVEVVGNGQLALKALTRTRFDLVLMDCQMPELDGFEATRGIRQLERAGRQLCDAGRLPVIALTANAIDGDRQRCLSAGMDGYVTKPVDPDALEKAMRPFARKPAAVRPIPVEAAPRLPAPQPPTPQPSQPAVIADPSTAIPIDMPSLMKRCRRKGSLVEKLLGKLAEQLPRQLQAIRRTADEQDLAALARLAHSVKGSAANLSADPLRDAASELEKLGIAQDAAALSRQMDAFAAELRRCLEYLPLAINEARSAAD